MAIVPINGISVRQNHSNMVSFSGRNEDERPSMDRRLPKASAAKAVPVIVLMAMNPGLLNTSGIAKAAPLETEALTEMVAENNKVSDIDEATYVMDMAAPETLSNLTPGQRKYLQYRAKDIIYKKNAGNGGVLVFEKLLNSKDARFINYLPGDSNYDGSIIKTPMVTLLVYHNLGKDKEYCGVLTRLYVKDSSLPKGGYYLDKEYRITDEVANDLIHLVTDDSEFKNTAKLKWLETTSPNLLPTEKIEPKDYPF